MTFFYTPRWAWLDNATMRRSWLLLAFLITAAAQGQTGPSDFERVLIPIYLPAPVGGAFGAAWSTQTILFADATAPLRIMPGCDGSMFCDIQPRTSLFLENIDPAQTASHARFVFVARAQAEEARFSVCLRRTDTNAPCEPLPVAREADFKSRIVLPFVPLQNGTRMALRVYGLTATSIRLRMYRLDRLDPLVDETELLVPDDPSTFIVLDPIGRWSQLQVAASVRIEIDSPDRVWAFASVTNNGTQEVSVFTP
jgi:hypothetical protein